MASTSRYPTEGNDILQLNYLYITYSVGLYTKLIVIISPMNPLYVALKYGGGSNQVLAEVSDLSIWLQATADVVAVDEHLRSSAFGGFKRKIGEDFFKYGVEAAGRGLSAADRRCRLGARPRAHARRAMGARPRRRGDGVVPTYGVSRDGHPGFVTPRQRPGDPGNDARAIGPREPDRHP